MREFGEGSHQVVDDRPFGGGAGMILKPDILSKALKKAKEGNPNSKVILTSASGKTLTQRTSRELSKELGIILICGHYEGIDERFITKYVDEEISIGDYVLTGGELPAMVITDSITRLIPKVLEKEEATIEESFENGLLEYPQYTRPEDFEGEKVPHILLSGDHKKIKEWRENKALKKNQRKKTRSTERLVFRT